MMTTNTKPKAPPKDDISKSRIIRLRPDLRVEIVGPVSGTVTNCHTVTFKAILDPSPIPAKGVCPVTVRAFDTIFGVRTRVGECTLYLPTQGGSMVSSFVWDPPDAPFLEDSHHKPWRNEITVEVDPDNVIPERYEKNNVITFFGACP